MDILVDWKDQGPRLSLNKPLGCEQRSQEWLGALRDLVPYHEHRQPSQQFPSLAKCLSKSAWFLSAVLHYCPFPSTLLLVCHHKFVIFFQEEEGKAYVAFMFGKAKLNFVSWC